MDNVIPYLARWLHIASAITLLGGMIFALVAWLPALNGASGTGVSAEKQALSDTIAARFRPWLLMSTGGLLLSGLYNYMRHAAAKDVPTAYHMLFGMKFLLALHVFAVGWIALNKGNTKRARQIAGVVISGLIVVALSAGMRYLALSNLHPVLLAAPAGATP